MFSFFTILSNVLVLVAAIGAALGRDTRPGAGRGWRLLHLDALLSIVVTGSVFGFVLAPGLQLRDEAVVATALFHNVSPVLFALAWLVFGPRRWWSIRIAALAFIWPAVWLAFTFTRGAITDWYPYPFLDVNQVGAGTAALGALAVVAFAVVLTAVILVIDRFAPSLSGSATPAADGRPDAPTAAGRATAGR
nr:Pr6Pr family membrane protein [Schumannella luteola]